MHTPPTQPFNAQLPQSFNPHVPPPYFPQYPPINSPSAHSTNSSILLALQKQWERQERLDMECNAMEKQNEERKSMKEEREPSMLSENYFTTIHTSAPRQLDCFTIALGKKDWHYLPYYI